MKKKAKDIMTRDPKAVKKHTPLREIVKTLLEHNISGMPVVDHEDKLIGIITEKDLINFVFSGTFFEAKAAEAMEDKVMSFEADVDALTICDFFIKNRIRRVPVTESGRLVGMISRRDLLREIPEMYKKKL